MACMSHPKMHKQLSMPALHAHCTAYLCVVGPKDQTSNGFYLALERMRVLADKSGRACQGDGMFAASVNNGTGSEERWPAIVTKASGQCYTLMRSSGVFAAARATDFLMREAI